MGTLVFGWTTYDLWAASEAGAKKPLIYGNIVLIITAVVLVLLYWKRYENRNCMD
ncbi:MAG: hypothetical protein ACLVB1_06845 [Blautia obeum]